MSFSKPLGYEAQKILLQYMDATQRMEFARRSPSIRTMDKIVPLRIANLAMGTLNFTVNKTRFKLSLIRKFKDINEMEELTSPWFSETEPFGYYGWSIGQKQIEGDFSMMDIDRYNSMIANYGERGFERNLVFPLPTEDQRKVRRDYCCENTPPHVVFIKLTISFPKGVKIETVMHTKRMSEAQRYLTTNMFAHRWFIVLNLKSLVIPPDDFIFRLPPKISFKFNELDITKFNSTPIPTIINMLTYSLVTLVLPLNTFVMRWTQGFWFAVRRNIILSAKKLIIFNENVRFLLDDLVRLPNKEVHTENDSFSPEEFVRFIKRKNPKFQVGHRYSFVIGKENVEDLYKAIKKISKVYPDKSLKYRVKNGPKVIISFKADNNDEKKWRMNWEVAA